jgi:nitrate/nitrite transporter NarK
LLLPAWAATRVFYGVAGLCAMWAVVVFAGARNAPAPVKPVSFGTMMSVLATERLAWALSAFYFLTFGGFVAFSVYLPTLLRDVFALTMTAAGFRTAGFVVLATLMRPVGGILSDYIGGARVLSGVFAGVVPFGLLLMWPSMLPFTVGALGCAALLGAGNGAVFKLVPQLFPNNTATVTGLVGAVGGLGGFFPPLLLGLFRDRTGTLAPGFALLALTAAALWLLNQRVFMPRQRAVRAWCGSTRLSEDCRAAACSLVGDDGDGAARGGDRRRLPQPAAFRCGARDLHVCGDFRDVGHHLPLRRVAEQAAHAAVFRAQPRARTE